MNFVMLAFLLCLSAFFSATETAFSSLSTTRLKTLTGKKAQMAIDLVGNYDKLISSVLIGNNIVNIVMASLGTVMFVQYMGDIGATVSSAVITVAVLIFGEITPKNIAKDCPEKFAMFAAPIIKVLVVILTPLNFVFSKWNTLLSKALKTENEDKMSQEELLMLVDEVEQDGSINGDEGELLRNAIEFTDTEAGEILTHRTDLEALSVCASRDELKEKFEETKFSRILIYRDSIDDIIGFIHQKNFFAEKDSSLESLITPVIFAIENEQICNLLKRLQKAKTHIAVILDEFGGTSGIVTMEDILEELVGEIWDEHDEVVIQWKELNDGRFWADASINLGEFSELLDIEIESEAVSCGGWIGELLGRMAEIGDKVRYKNIEIEVTNMDSHRISEINVTKEEKQCQISV